jgi:hypothetical protein
MKAMLFLLLILAVIVFVSFYGSSLRPYWEERLPRVASHLGEGDFREAASAMVDEPDDAPVSSMVVETSSSEPDTLSDAADTSTTRDE